jgi:hypothetical protein
MYETHHADTHVLPVCVWELCMHPLKLPEIVNLPATMHACGAHNAGKKEEWKGGSMQQITAQQ